MKEENLNEQQALLQELVEQGLTNDLLETLEDMPTAEVVDFLTQKSHHEIMKFLNLLGPDISGRIFSDFPRELQTELFNIIDKSAFSNLFSNMYSDVRADFYQELNKEEQIELLPYLEKGVREDVIILSAYPPETAGGIMNTDFATIYINMTVVQAIAKIRKDAPSQKMIYYIYVVDEKMQMLGLVTLKDLIMADPKEKVSELLQEFFVYAEVNEDRESVAQKIEKYDLVAIPVLNSLKQLVGIVSHEEAIDVIRAEQTEDMEKFMGIVPSVDELSYLDTSTILHFKKRVLWIVCLAAVGLISGVIVHHYQSVVEKLIILALYMPMMAATGGNSGSQAATVVIRALSLGEIQDNEWLRILFKEAKISFLLSFCVAALVFIKIVFLTSQGTVPSDISLITIGTLISVAIAIQVITSAVIGAGLPLLVRRFGGDPAVAASPAITTVVDITGLLIYFAISSLALT